ncbi:hypothetical protein Pyn_33735 [Prunus yedoensis var. nudiflora]|uniref:Uncharacterized protein n=1 Tax=Prunus yedoensis var. nudiflora TaxID=2094558 RepID=A0A314XL53_PRUYE|nr:hypothetical protein Pyn_33735 [Prunus yedoensis var. nudiflora]
MRFYGRVPRLLRELLYGLATRYSISGMSVGVSHVVLLRLYHYGSGNSSSNIRHSCRHCPTPSSSIASYSSSSGTSNMAADTALSLPAALPPTPPLPGTSDMAADTALRLLAALPPTPFLLGTSDIAAGTALHLPAVLPPTPPLPGTSNMVADTALHLPVALPPTLLLLGTSDIVAGTALHLPAAPPVDWENSLIAFKAFFDGGVKILRSIDELLPLCYQFDGYAMFQSAFVYPETIRVLRKFMDKNVGFMDITGVTSSFSRSAAFRALGLVLHGMDTM